MSEKAIEVSRKEFSSEEVLDHLDDGQRVVVSVEVLGVERDVTLRRTDEQYVCDTGLKLMSYDDRDGLRACIEKLRLTDSE